MNEALALNECGKYLSESVKKFQMDALKMIAKSDILMENMDGDLKEFIENYSKPGLTIGDVNDFPRL